MKDFLAAHKLAVAMTGITAALYTGCGLAFAHFEHIPAWHGLYCATANAMTEGDCDVPATNAAGYIINTIEHLALVALAATALGVFTSRLSSALVRKHVEDATEVIKAHTEARLRHHLNREEGHAGQPDEHHPRGGGGSHRLPGGPAGQAGDSPAGGLG